MTEIRADPFPAGKIGLHASRGCAREIFPENPFSGTFEPNLAGTASNVVCSPFGNVYTISN
jgi:hypothetical protein